jgi:hypothetical protein
LIVRQARGNDVAALCELMQHVQTLHAEAYPEIFRSVLDPESTSRFFADIVAQDRNIVLVASIDERTIGYVWCEERISAGSFYAHESIAGIFIMSRSPRAIEGKASAKRSSIRPSLR